MSHHVADFDWRMRLAKIFLTPNARRRMRERRRVEPFRQLLRPTDVFLIGHPKSGNTWLAYLLAILLLKHRSDEVNLSNVGNYVPFIHGQDYRLAEFDHLMSPRIFRNECPIFPSEYPRIIYILRNPLAVLVSFFHMYRVMSNDRKMTLDDFIDSYLATQGCFTEWNAGLIRWDRQVTTWLNRASHDDRVLVVRYEDLVKDLTGELRRLARFLGISAHDDDLDRAAHCGNFSAMQAMEDKFGAEAYPGELGKRGRFIRRGRIDGWRDEMDPELAGRIVDVFAPAMRLAGYL